MQRLVNPAPTTVQKVKPSGTIRVSTREYCLLHNIYMTAELLSQAVYTRQNPAEAQFNLNRALAEYKGWSEQAAARFKALHHPKRTASTAGAPSLKSASKKLLTNRRRFAH